MKESISYTFVLNIVILFIFICFAIVLGIFSYYRAFKAGVIIVDTIEKYEGYNCLSAEEIGRKLSTISYNVPFNANCNKADGSPCMVDANKNYAVISYNLSANVDNFSQNEAQVTEEYINKQGAFVAIDANNPYEEMNSRYYYRNNGGYTKEYQYGVITYMYVDLPVVSNLLKLTVYSKTRTMYEFRNLQADGKGGVYNKRLLPDGLRSNDLASIIHKGFAASMTGHTNSLLDEEYNARKAFLYDPGHNGYAIMDSVESGIALGDFKYSCGEKIDYSLY